MSTPHQHAPPAAHAEWWRHAPPTGHVAQAPALADTESRWPFRMLMAFTFILLLAPQMAFPVLAPLRLALMVIVASILSYMYSRAESGRAMFEIKPGIVPVLLLAVWAVLTVPASYWPGGTVTFLMEEYFKTLIVFLLLTQIVDSAGKLRTLCWGLVLMALPLAATGLLNFAAGNNLSQGDRVLGYNAPLTANPNDLALMLNLILPFAVALFLSAPRPMLRIVAGLTVCILVAAIVVTFSRAGFIALALIFIIYMWRLRHRRERAWIPLVLVLILASLPFVPASYYERISTIADIETDTTQSAQTRWSDMVVATKLVIAKPLIGAGAGMNMFAMNEARGDTSLEIHNVYLQYGVDLGLPGLILFLALFISCLRTAQDVIERSRVLPDPNGLFYLAEGIKVSLMAFAVEALFHPVAYNFYFYYIAGLAVALRTVYNREAGTS